MTMQEIDDVEAEIVRLLRTVTDEYGIDYVSLTMFMDRPGRSWFVTAPPIHPGMVGRLSSACKTIAEHRVRETLERERTEYYMAAQAAVYEAQRKALEAGW